MYVWEAVSVPVPTLPEVAFAPDHAPPAVHEVAFVELHVIVEAAPYAMLVGEAERLAVAGGNNTTILKHFVVPPNIVQMSPVFV